MPDNDVQPMGDTDVSASNTPSQAAPLNGATTDSQGGNATGSALAETTGDAKT